MVSERNEHGKWQLVFKDPYDGALRSLLPDIEREAIAAGARNHPPTDAPIPDSSELRVKSIAESLLRQCDQHFLQKIRDLRKTFDELGATADLDTRREEIRAIIDGAQTKLATAITEEKSSILNLTKKHLENQAALNGFVADHQLKRPAYYPESVAAHYMWVAATAIIEAIASFLFYVEKRDPLTALMTAFLAGAIVVAMSALLGNLFRFKNHTHPGVRSTGWVVAPIWFVSLVCLSKLLAFYRDNPNIHELGIMTVIVDWNLSPEAWLMFMFTILVGSFGFWKGYQSDDPVPGYGRISRATDHAKADLDGAVAAIREKAKRFSDDQSKIISEFESDVQYRARNIRRVQADLNAVRNSIQANRSSILRDFNHAISIYRARNSSVRTASQPTYFNATHELDDISLAVESLPDNGHLTSIVNNCEGYAADLVNVTKSMRQAVAQIAENQERLLDAMVDECSKRASNEIGRSHYR